MKVVVFVIVVFVVIFVFLGGEHLGSSGCVVSDEAVEARADEDVGIASPNHVIFRGFVDNVGVEFIGAEFCVASGQLHRRIDFLPNFLINFFQLIGVREFGSDQNVFEASDGIPGLS